MKYIDKISVIACCLAISSTFAAPWFTGPLLAPSGQTIPKGHFNFEPYLMFTDSFGVYNRNWRVTKVPDTKTFNAMPVISYGLTDFMDLQAVLPYRFNSKNNQHSSQNGDLTLIAGFQAYKQRPGHWLPSLRVTVGEILPIGNYNNLNPARQGVDAGGSGLFQTAIGFNFQQVMQPYNEHYLRSRFALTATLPGSVNVKGFNAYGGGVDTNGSLNPGVQVQGDLAFEYQLTQHLVSVLEFTILDRERSTFNGAVGRTLTGLPATVGHGEVEQITFAPALEYNFNAHLGVIAGVWLSLTGKDSNQFITGAVALNYYV